MHKIVNHLIRSHGIYEKAFYIANMSLLKEKIELWKTELPMVQPFYAVKCNPNERIVKTMIENSIGFDCASKSEMQSVLELGGNVNNIIYAHPVKTVGHLNYAAEVGIKMTTFDSLSELEKIKRYANDIKCIIRLKIDNPSARVQLGLKYGVARDEYKGLIDAARDMNLDVIGISYHVGSSSRDPKVFIEANDYSREVFHYMKSKGYRPSILDIGGGFTGESFIESATVLKKSFAENFGDLIGCELKIIAEPGRFFAEDIFTFFVPVIGHRKRNEKMEYWISDGLYGSFNCMLYDAQVPVFLTHRNPLLEQDNIEDQETPSPSIVYGQTCDSADKIGDEIMLPRLRNGDFLMIPRFGAYTVAGSCNFNGINMTRPMIFYVENGELV